MKRGLLVILFALVLGAAAQPPPVRVLLEETGLAVVELEGAHSLWNWAGRIADDGGPRVYRLLASDRGIELVCDDPPCPASGYMGNLLSFVPREGAFAVSGRRYRGFLRVVWQDGRLLLINRVGLEDYLRGVLPGEVPASFPFEVLRAQAILARTYTLSRLGSNPYYDLCDTARCQVYLGLDAETPRHTQAVRATAGRILAYRGEPISAVYHADSGGTTAAAEEVWGGPIPYLQARDDPWSLAKRWRVQVNPRQVQRVLQDLGFDPGAVQSMKVLDKGPSGRITRLEIVGTSARIVLETPKSARFLRALGLPSTLASLSGWTFSGRGSGHGVGMSQWGARGFAKRGWNYREILAYYYPHTVLTSYRLSASR